jgi:hypothetical protein
MKVAVAGLFAGVALVLILGSNGAGQERPKYQIAEIMAKAMKSNLYNRVAEGQATPEEKRALVELFTALHLNTPPKGDTAAWKEKTYVLLEAARQGNGAILKKTANCTACHNAHKK